MILSSASFASESYTLKPNKVERDLGELIVSHPKQKRREMIHDPILLLVARAKAEDLGKRGYEAHVDPDGVGPNAALLAAGYGLPGWWAPQTTIKSNNVESLGFGYGGTHRRIFEGWIDSPAHRRHILGESDFYATQTHYAVGYAEVPNSRFTHYYVLITAPPNESALQNLEPYNQWLFEHFTVRQILTDNDATDSDGDGFSRLLEFALDLDPHRKDLPLGPPKPAGKHRFEWPLAIRENLGSIEVEAEFSSDLQSWDDDIGDDDADGLVVHPSASTGFMRLRVTRSSDES